MGASYNHNNGEYVNRAKVEINGTRIGMQSVVRYYDPMEWDYGNESCWESYDDED